MLFVITHAFLTDQCFLRSKIFNNSVLYFFTQTGFVQHIIFFQPLRCRNLLTELFFQCFFQAFDIPLFIEATVRNVRGNHAVDNFFTNALDSF